MAEAQKTNDRTSQKRAAEDYRRDCHSTQAMERERQIKMASLKETRVMIDNVNNSQNSCHIMQMFQIMQRNQAAPAIPVNNAGALFQMMMLQVVQKMVARPLRSPSWRRQCFSALMNLPFVQPGNAQISR